MKIVKVRLSGDKRRKTEVVLNSNNIAYEGSWYKNLNDNDLCEKLLNIVLEDTSEIKFDSVTFTQEDIDDCEDNDPWRTYTLKANVNYKGINMILELNYDICDSRKDISIRLCDPNHCGCIGHFNDYKNINDDFITQLINTTNINYYLNDEKVDEYTFKLYYALNN